MTTSAGFRRQHKKPAMTNDHDLLRQMRERQIIRDAIERDYGGMRRAVIHIVAASLCLAILVVLVVAILS